MLDTEFLYSFTKRKLVKSGVMEKFCLDCIYSNIADISSLVDPRVCIVNSDSLPKDGELFDCIISVNDFPYIYYTKDYISKIAKIAKQGGFIFISAFETRSFTQARQSLIQAYAMSEKGYIEHFMPLADIKSAGQLLQSMGFIDIITSIERKVLEFGSISECLRYIRHECAPNFIINRHKAPICRNILEKANEIFLNQYQGRCDFVPLFAICRKRSLFDII